MEDIVRLDCIAALRRALLRQRHGSCVGVPAGTWLSPFGGHKDSSSGAPIIDEKRTADARPAWEG